MGSSKSAVAEGFIPWQSANATYQSFLKLFSIEKPSFVKHLPAHRYIKQCLLKYKKHKKLARFFFFFREGRWERGKGRGRRILSRLHAQCRAQRWSQSHNLVIMT